MYVEEGRLNVVWFILFYIVSVWTHVACYNSIHQAMYYICLDNEWGKAGHINITIVISHGIMLNAMKMIMIYCIYLSIVHMSSVIW